MLSNILPGFLPAASLSDLLSTNALLDASFRGVPFDCQATNEPTKRALAIHEYPFKDGGEVDDMGRRARTFSLRAVFFGGFYQADLKKFLAALDAGGEGELVHPIYGSHTVMVQDYEPQHEADGPDSCTVAVTFVESGLHTPFFTAPETARGKAESATDAAESALEAAEESVSGGFTEWVDEFLTDNPATSAINAVSDIVNEGVAMANAALGEVVSTVGGVVGGVVSCLEAPLALVGQLEGIYSKVEEIVTISGATDGFSGWQRISDLYKGVSCGGTFGAKTYSTIALPASVTPPTLQALAEDAAGGGQSALDTAKRALSL